MPFLDYADAVLAAVAAGGWILAGVVTWRHRRNEASRRQAYELGILHAQEMAAEDFRAIPRR
ncbi:hypothetical protein [Nonomuraea endophytica]|uniref:Uncharacterized protein n=1 Tax=Nonomuraea endophytica TaxID=714136 RepID=A0A7W8A9Y9_9ACTN|nr:hypothetical protein [Nonomuraea endophytica]MBB5081306.1 hypothetical protein [Nonomuraea endophytica]